jgi:hypothetical protein
MAASNNDRLPEVFHCVKAIIHVKVLCFDTVLQVFILNGLRVGGVGKLVGAWRRTHRGPPDFSEQALKLVPKNKKAQA